MSSEGAAQEVRRIFTQNTVREALEYLNSVNRNIEDSGRSLKEVIGGSYRDLIDTCNRVVGMGGVCREIVRLQDTLRTGELLPTGKAESAAEKRTVAAAPHCSSLVSSKIVEASDGGLEGTVDSTRLDAMQQILIKIECQLSVDNLIEAARTLRCAQSFLWEHRTQSMPPHLLRAVRFYEKRLLLLIRSHLRADADACANAALEAASHDAESLLPLPTVSASLNDVIGASPPCHHLRGIGDNMEKLHYQETQARRNVAHYHIVLQQCSLQSETITELFDELQAVDECDAESAPHDAFAPLRRSFSIILGAVTKAVLCSLNTREGTAHSRGLSTVSSLGVLASMAYFILLENLSACVTQTRQLHCDPTTRIATFLRDALHLPDYLFTPPLRAVSVDTREVDRTVNNSIFGVYLVYQAEFLFRHVLECCTHEDGAASTNVQGSAARYSGNGWAVGEPATTTLSEADTVEASRTRDRLTLQQLQNLRQCLLYGGVSCAVSGTESHEVSVCSSTTATISPAQSGNASVAQISRNATQRRCDRQRYIDGVLQCASQLEQLHERVFPPRRQDNEGGDTVPNCTRDCGCLKESASILKDLQRNVLQPYVSSVLSCFCRHPRMMLAAFPPLTPDRSRWSISASVDGFDKDAWQESVRGMVSSSLLRGMGTALRYASCAQWLLVHEWLLRNHSHRMDATRHAALEGGVLQTEVEKGHPEASSKVRGAVEVAHFPAMSAFCNALLRCKPNWMLNAEMRSPLPFREENSFGVTRCAHELLRDHCTFGAQLDSCLWPVAVTEERSEGQHNTSAAVSTARDDSGRWLWFVSEGVFVEDQRLLERMEDKSSLSSAADRLRELAVALSLPLDRGAALVDVLEGICAQVIDVVSMLQCGLEKGVGSNILSGGDALRAFHDTMATWLGKSLQGMESAENEICSQCSYPDHLCNGLEAVETDNRDSLLSLYELASIASAHVPIALYLNQAHVSCSNSVPPLLARVEGLFQRCHASWRELLRSEYEAAITSAYTYQLNALQESCAHRINVPLSQLRSLYRRQQPMLWGTVSVGGGGNSRQQITGACPASVQEYHYPLQLSGGLESMFSYARMLVTMMAGGKNSSVLSLLSGLQATDKCGTAACPYGWCDGVADDMYTRLGESTCKAVKEFVFTSMNGFSLAGEGDEQQTRLVLADFHLQLWFDTLFLHRAWRESCKDRDGASLTFRREQLEADAMRLRHILSDRCDAVLWNACIAPLQRANSQLFCKTALSFGILHIPEQIAAEAASDGDLPAPTEATSLTKRGASRAHEAPRFVLLPIATPAATGSVGFSGGSSFGRYGRKGSGGMLYPRGTTLSPAHATLSQKTGALDMGDSSTAGLHSFPTGAANSMDAAASLWDTTQRGWTNFWSP